MRKFFSTIFVVVMVFVAVTMAYGQTNQKHVESTGEAEIGTKGMSMVARTTALERARRNAVEDVVGNMLNAETMVENYELINTEIYAKSSVYVCGEEVTDERNDHDTYIVTLNVCVAEDALEKDLRSIGIFLPKFEYQGKKDFLLNVRNVSRLESLMTFLEALRKRKGVVKVTIEVFEEDNHRAQVTVAFTGTQESLIHAVNYTSKAWVGSYSKDQLGVKLK